MPLDKTPWTDETVMPWGKHKGTVMSAIPLDHLMWLSEQRWIGDWPGLKAYLKQSTVIARVEAARKARRDDPTVPDSYRTFDDYLADWR